jgi:hypothetical protein
VTSPAPSRVRFIDSAPDERGRCHFEAYWPAADLHGPSDQDRWPGGQRVRGQLFFAVPADHARPGDIDLSERPSFDDLRRLFYPEGE